MVRHHNKLGVRPTLLETKFQVPVAKHKGDSSPQSCDSVGPTEEFLVVSTFSLNVFGGFVVVWGFESNDELQKFLLKKTSSFVLKR